jgi:sterol desaturase/sphingolipid hydroxylase (fatty acid hydroxylase superfamily)
MTTLYDALSTSWSPEFWDHVAEGIELSSWTFCLTVLFEIYSLDTVKRLLIQKGAGPWLYAAAILSNLRNHFCFGAPIYVVAVENFCRPTHGKLGIGDQIVCVATILFVHSICFYSVHRLFHSCPQLYRHHRFHHRFNVHVPPMAANAVSPVEYVIAYILPFVIAMPFVEPDTMSIRLSVSILSLTNILIHTPKLAELSVKVVPEWLVTTEDHLEHHRKLNTKYAAPTFNIDYFVSFIEKQPEQSTK